LTEKALDYANLSSSVQPSLFDLAHNKKDKPSSPKDSSELEIEPAK
jgi:hypothetical protein